MYFRPARTILIKNIIRKKNVVQKYITKKISAPVKRDHFGALVRVSVKELLMQSNVFHTLKDSIQYVTRCGLYINNNITHNPSYEIKEYDTFTLAYTKLIGKFLKSKKIKMQRIFSRMKFHKHRIKMFTKKRRYN